MYRRYARLYFRAARRHLRLMAGAGGVLFVIAMAAMIGSCQNQAAPPEPAPATPRPAAHPPKFPSIIRVRMLDPIDTATIGATGPYRLVADGAIHHTGEAMPTTSIHRRGGLWVIGSRRIAASRLRLEPTSYSTFVTCNGRRYRGALVLLDPTGAPDRFAVNNDLPLEHYLPGVLSRELLRTWNLETYKALAVTARTYAMYEMTHDGQSRSFDVYADQRSQVYGGVDDETTRSVDAVRATHGLVLSAGDGATPHIFKSYYSSCCGGMTCPAEGLEPQDEQVAPLAGGVTCTDCSFSSRYRWDPVRIDKQAAFGAIQRQYPKIAAMGPLTSIRVHSTTAWGRPQEVDIVAGDGNTSRIRADDVRLALLRSGVPGADRIYSMSCTLTDSSRELVFADGRGFGHSVGLCQYGAEGKARRGLQYHQILYAYFPGARILRAY